MSESETSYPADWDSVPLESIASVERGKFTHRPRNDPKFYGGTFPFIQTGDVANAGGRVITTYSQTLSEKGTSVSREFPVDTIAITIAANIADTAVLGIPMYFPDSIVAAIVRQPHVPRYVELCIRRAKKKLDIRAPQSAQKNINLSDLRPLPIPLPEPAEQRRIAEILDTADAAIQKTEALIAKLKQMKAGLLHDLLTRGIDENGELRDHLFTHSRARKFDQLPTGYSRLSFGELAEYYNGKGFNEQDWKDSGLPIIRIQNLNGEETFNYYTGPVNSTWEVFTGDLLFAWSGTRETSFGPRIWNGPHGVLNQHIFKVVPKRSLVSTGFLNVLLRFYLELIAESAHGFKSSFVHVKRGDITSVVVPVPPTTEQDEIMKRLNSQNQKLRQEEATLDKLHKLKTGLMHDLLTGKKRVNQPALAAT